MSTAVPAVPFHTVLMSGPSQRPVCLRKGLHLDGWEGPVEMGWHSTQDDAVEGDGLPDATQR